MHLKNTVTSRGIKIDDRMISIRDMKQKLKIHNALQIPTEYPDQLKK